jgi:hypothetical protein
MSEADRLLKVAQVAIMANVSPETVRRDVRKGALLVLRVGPTRRIRVRLPEARRYAGLDPRQTT